LGLEVGAAVGSIGAWPVVQVQFQTHGVLPVGTTTFSGDPGTTTATTTLFGVVIVDTTALPCAGAVFSWVAGSLSPGLATRTETSTLLGAVCSAVADAFPLPASRAGLAGAAGFVAFGEDVGHRSPHCVRSCPTELELSTCAALFAAFGSGSVPTVGVTFAGSAIVDVASDSFTCVRGSSSPGLPTRTETLRFVGETCVEFELADGPVGTAGPAPTGGLLAATAVAVDVLR
jgi:hypothetical protein